MGNMNKVLLIGRLGQDPELKYVGNNETPVVNVSLATSEKYKDKKGNQVENTEWHNLTFWNRTAEIVGEWCRSGSQIFVEGKIKTEQWVDDDDNTRYTTKIIVQSLQLLDPPLKDDDEPSRKKKPKHPPKKGKGKPFKKQSCDDGEYVEDDIPF